MKKPDYPLWFLFCGILRFRGKLKKEETEELSFLTKEDSKNLNKIKLL